MVRTQRCADGAVRPVLSASSAQLWRDCPRAWGHRYLDGIRDPETPSKLLGTSVHAQVERYYRSEIDAHDDVRLVDLPQALRLGYSDALVRVRRIVRAFLAPGVLPPRGPAVRVEGSIHVERAHAVWQGYVDLRVAPARAGDQVRVLDHKTTSDIGYALTPEKLARNLQGVIYASAALEENAQAPAAALQWTYVPTRGRAVAHPVRALVSRDEARERMMEIDAGTGAEVARVLRDGARSTDLRQEWRACDNYGGCPHRSRCGSRPVAVALEMLMSDGRDGSQQTLFQALGGNPVPATPAPAPVAGQVHDPAAWPLREVTSATPAPEPAPQAPAQAQAFPPPMPNPFATAETPTRVNPPGSPAPARYPDLYAAAGGPALQTVAFPVAPAEHLEARRTEQTASTMTQAQMLIAAAQGVQTTLDEGVARGAIAATPAPVATPVLDPQQDTTGAWAPSGSYGYVLCVGCTLQAPAAVRGCSFNQVARRAHDLLREHKGISDYRLVQYGEGRGHFRQAILLALDEAALGPDAFLYVDHMGPEWEVAGVDVTARAGIVARAVAA